MLPNLRRRFEEGSWAEQEELEPYRSLRPCPKCHGHRLKPEILAVKVKGREKSLKLARELMREGAKERIPDFLEVVPGEIPEGRLTRVPSRGDVDPRLAQNDQPLQEQLIIEFCGR